MNLKNAQATPVGMLKWAYLLEPRDGKFGQTYEANLVLTAEDAAPLMADIAEELRIQGEVDGTSLEGAKKPYTVDESGMVEFKFSLFATGKKRDGSTFTSRPQVEDAQGKKLTVNPGNGSRGQVYYQISAYTSKQTGALGCSLRLKGVQVSELIEYKPRARPEDTFVPDTYQARSASSGSADSFDLDDDYML